MCRWMGRCVGGCASVCVGGVFRCMGVSIGVCG